MKKFVAPLLLAAAVALPTVAQANTFREIASTNFTASSSSVNLDFTWGDVISSRPSRFGTTTVESDGAYKLRIVNDSTGKAVFRDDTFYVGDIPGLVSGSFSNTFGGLSAGTSYTVLFIGRWLAPDNPRWSTLVSPTVTVSAVPEPETYAMFLAGLGIIGVIARRRRSN